MNRYALNARPIGSGVSRPAKFWSASVAIAVESVEDFFNHVGILWESAISVTNSSDVNVTRQLVMLMSQSIRVSNADAFTRIQAAASSVSVSVGIFAPVLVGKAWQLISSVATGVVVSSAFTRKCFFNAIEAVREIAVSRFGYLIKISAAQPIQEGTYAHFTVFGYYAPYERTTVVPAPDERTTVVPLDLRESILPAAITSVKVI